MTTKRLLVLNPSADVYGSDLQLLETVRATCATGWEVVVWTPTEGPLVDKLRREGARVDLVEYPVLRRAFASPRGLAHLVRAATPAMFRLRTRIRELDPCVAYVNTVTLPWCTAAARLAGVPVVCHVHEAETADRRALRRAMTAPLLLASSVIANGEAARRAACDVVPGLRSRIEVIENGVTGPPRPIRPVPRSDPVRLCTIGRLSPRKATHVAIEALALLRAAGRDVQLELCGSVFDGYEWYEQELRDLADERHVRESVVFSGYVSDIWSALERSTIVVAPSLGESLGNAVIQAQMARRPVVASNVQGHDSSIVDGATGALVAPDDSHAVAEAVADLLDNPERAVELAENAERSATRRYSVQRYHRAICETLTRMCSTSAPARGASTA